MLAVGARPGEAFRPGFWELAWAETREAFAFYNEKRYAEAADVLRGAVAKHPAHAGVHYNLACFAALAGEIEEALAELLIAVEKNPAFAEHARGDSDFDGLRDDPRFESALAGKPDAAGGSQPA